jgi:hypothetical protein
MLLCRYIEISVRTTMLKSLQYVVILRDVKITDIRNQFSLLFCSIKHTSKQIDRFIVRHWKQKTSGKILQ